jgi:hypothetical protein
MSQLPVRSLRLRSYTTADLDRLSGDRGAVFYDGELKTLKIYNGPGQTASSVAVIEDGARLALGTTSGAIYANQTTGQITIGDYIGPGGAPSAPSTVIAVGGTTNVFQISTYGPPARVWTFGKNGGMTFPDATVQTTAWTGVADYRNLTNKPDIPEAYSFSVAADDSTQRAISNNELIKFIGAGSITTASDAEGNITITGAESDRLSVTGSSAVLAKDQYDTTRLTFTGSATIETAGYLTGVGGLALVDNTSQQYVIVKPNRVQINTGFPDGGTGTGSYNEWQFLKSGVFQLSTTGIIENTGKQWTFGTTGTLTIPGDIRSEGNINIDINLADSTLRRWQFGEDGELTFPDGTNQTTAFTGSVETFTSPTITANAATLNFNSSAIFALGSNAANITANFTNIPGTAGQTISTTLIITQGATAYIPSAVTINGGGSVTPKWQGGTVPTAVINRVNIVSFTFICTATNTWTVIGSLVDYN